MMSKTQNKMKIFKLKKIKFSKRMKIKIFKLKTYSVKVRKNSP